MNYFPSLAIKTEVIIMAISSILLNRILFKLKSIYKKMSSFQAFWIPFERIFQIFCVSHYSIFRPKIHQNWLKTLLLVIYFISFSVLHIILIIYTLKHGLHIEVNAAKDFKRSPIMFYVNYMSTSGNLVSHITAHLEAIFMGNKESQLYEKFDQINKIFETKLKYKLNYQQIRRDYLLRIVSFFIFITSVSVLTSYFSLSNAYANKYLFVFIRICGVATIRARGCYILLIIKLFVDFLGHLKKTLILHQNNCQQHLNGLPDPSYPIENILFHRDIYTKLRIAMNLISDVFGWSMITFLAQFSLDLINLSYWIYINSTVVESWKINFCMPNC